MKYEFLKTSVHDRVGWIEYRRPPRNAIDWTMLREIPVALDGLLKDSGVRVIVIASALDAFFSTGADLRVLAAMQPGEMRGWVEICHGLVRQIHSQRLAARGSVRAPCSGRPVSRSSRDLAVEAAEGIVGVPPEDILSAHDAPPGR